jgi:radical SAM superfamily enzyme YgiQ (UPF0313 family)
MLSPTSSICNGKPRGIFINAPKANCSIYESGVMVYNCLKLSDKYSIDYTEIDPRNLKLDKYDFYFFNYHHATMNFIDTSTVRRLSGLTIATILETLPNNPFPLCPPGDFDIYCAIDPTMNIPDRRVYAFPRPLEVAEHITSYKETGNTVVGSFGFATPGKGFELVVDAVNREFDEAVIRINIPCSTYADDVTFKLFRQKYSDYLSDLCKKAAKPGINVVITNDFMDKRELIEWCGQNTLNCFFYDRNQPGLAATTDQAITSERPMLVSANDTFRHIHQYIKPYPYQTLKEAIKSSVPAVLKMKNDWHPQKFAEKFEIVLEDCNLLPRTKRENEINIVTSKGKKDTIMIVSHKKAQCGIYQYGVDISNALQKSEVYDFVYAECGNPSELNEAVTKCSPKVIIYNYYPFTMPWLNRYITRGYHVPQLAVMHEVTQEEADNATQEMFDGFLCPDPTLKENNPYVFKTARLIPTYCNNINIPDIPTIGSFGFGFCNKGFERLIDIAQKEFDRVRIRLHMPFNSIVDEKGAVHTLNTAQRCRNTIINKNVELLINHSYLSKEQLFEFLAGNTINAFFYDTSKNKGISSVIDSALAVRRPIAITKSGMFRHVLNATPSICIEDSTFRTIINNGIVPLVPFYNDWSEAAFIKRYEDVLDKILGKTNGNAGEIDVQEDAPKRKGIVVAVEKQDTMNDVSAIINEAERLIRAKDITKARGILNGILNHDSRNIVGLIDLSVCDILEGKNADAIKKLNIVLSIDPDNKVAKDNLQYIFQQRQSCKSEKRFNKILDNIAREEYKEIIKTMFVELPDMMARKIPEANVQQAFVYDSVMRFYARYSAPKILCVGSYEDTAAALLKKKGIVFEEIDPVINCDLNTFVNHPNTLKGSYDIVFSTSVIEHVQDDALFIRQIEQLLAPNGVAVITCDYNDDYQPGDKVPQEDYRFYTQKDLRERLMGYVPSCSLVDTPEWDCPNPDFVYGGCRYTFATLVFQKKNEVPVVDNRKPGPMQSRRLTLVNPPSNFSTGMIPLGPTSISAYLKQYGNISCSLLDANCQDIYADYRSSDVVGITSTTLTINEAIKFACYVKKNQNIPVILGGVHISTYKQLPEPFDIGVIGEGEQTMLELMNLPDFSIQNLRRVRGICYRSQGRVIFSEERELIENLDTIPMPDREIANLEYYLKPRKLIPYHTGRTLSMLTSRGCPFRCVFCSTSLHWKKFRAFSAERVADEIETLIERYGVEIIHIFDDLFIADKKRLIKIHDILVKKGINRKVKFMCLIRADITDEPVMRFLKEMNVVATGVGMESGSDRVLKYLKKSTTTVEMNRKLIELSAKYEIPTMGSFMIGNPGETIGDLLETLKFIVSYRHTPYFTPLTYIATAFPGTELWDYGLKNHIHVDDFENVVMDIPSDINILAKAPLFTSIPREIFFEISQHFVKETILKQDILLPSANEVNDKKSIQEITISGNQNDCGNIRSRRTGRLLSGADMPKSGH